MKNQRHTLRKIVSFLNNPDEDGGFWLPNIQRPFVWSEDQICRLFDSILREYPISTLLIWKTTSGIRRRKFIDNWKDSLKLSDFYVPEDSKKKCLVLDGQQRLQSLFIGLKGSFEGRELYLDILSGEVAAPDDVKYRFSFLRTDKAAFPQVLFKELVFTAKKPHALAEHIESAANRTLTDSERSKIMDHLNLVDRTFKMEEAVSYQELDGIDSPELYGEDDVVEIFIRANSGGTRLGKSDLLFSLLTSTWDEADQRMDELLDSLNKDGFGFTRDFVLKTCLTVIGQGARYEVEKFRKAGVRESIETQWGAISDAIRDVYDFLRGKTYIRCDKAIPSYLALIPLIYLRFHHPVAWKAAKGMDAFIVRTLLVGAFGGTPDQLIDDLVAEIKQSQAFDAMALFAVMQSRGRSLTLTEDRLWEMGYGSGLVHLLFNLWYGDFNYSPAYANNMPQVDHIFPQSALRKEKVVSPTTGKKNIMKYRDGDRNQLANCMLLTMEENGGGGKGDTLPDEWLTGKPEEYLDLHVIPRDPALWKLDRFEEFISARKDLLRQKFAHLLFSAAPLTP